MEHDYAAIDAEFKFNWRDERLDLSRRYGFRHISESIVKTYRSTKSGRKTGALLGGLSSGAVIMFLRKIGEPVNGPGGFRPGDKRHGRVIF